MNKNQKFFIYLLSIGLFLGIIAEHEGIGKYILIPSLIMIIVSTLVWKLPGKDTE